jgi:predicted component of type VI protein secretion system
MRRPLPPEAPLTPPHLPHVPPQPPEARLTPPPGLPAPPATPTDRLAAAAREPDRHHLLGLLDLFERALNAPIGEPGGADPRDLLLLTPAHLGHLDGEIQEITPPPDGLGRPWRVTVNLLGLTGPGTPLPLALAESLLRAPRPLLQAAQHALLALLYRGTRRLTAGATALHDPWITRLLALAALDEPAPRIDGPTASLPPQQPLTAAHRLHLLALKLQAPVTARALTIALRTLLSDLLPGGATLTCDDTVATTVPLAPADHPRLGQSARLGAASLAARRHLRGAELHLTITPLTVAAARQFRLGAPGHHRITQTLAHLLPRPWPWRLHLTIHDPHATPARLGATHLSDDAWLARRRPGVRAHLTQPSV